MHDALTARFTDADEIKDVANYGCAAGVSGFIYYSETTKFFDEYEDEIHDYLDDCGLTIKDFVDEDDAIHMIKNKMVWSVVELWCQAQQIATEMEEYALSA